MPTANGVDTRRVTTETLTGQREWPDNYIAIPGQVRARPGIWPPFRTLSPGRRRAPIMVSPSESTSSTPAREPVDILAATLTTWLHGIISAGTMRVIAEEAIRDLEAYGCQVTDLDTVIAVFDQINRTGGC